MAPQRKPEILPPPVPVSGNKLVFGDENLDLLSHLLDDFIRIPGTPIRFGLDGIVGFVPGIGDLLGGLASSILILAAWVRGVPRVVVVRMVANVAIETLAGSIPLLGNLFDIAWRANRRNYRLMTTALADPRRRTLGSWLFLGAICAVLALLVAVPVFLAGLLLESLGHWLAEAARS
jgi:hypothetical protein